TDLFRVYETDERDDRHRNRGWCLRHRLRCISCRALTGSALQSDCWTTDCWTTEGDIHMDFAARSDVFRGVSPKISGGFCDTWTTVSVFFLAAVLVNAADVVGKVQGGRGQPAK